MLSKKETRFFVKQILPNGKELFLKKTISNKPTWTKEYAKSQYFSWVWLKNLRQKIPGSGIRCR